MKSTPKQYLLKSLRNILGITLLLGNIGHHASAITLSDAPLYSTVVVPGNLALALSVEWPTATTPAYTTAYSAASTYLGYFDPAKCYEYLYDATTPSSSYFTPRTYSSTGSHTCTSTSAAPRWSGNFLNWVSMQTLDTFRWVLTGGYRSTDTTTNTVLTKTYAGFDSSSVIPNKSITTAGTVLSGATPLNTTTNPWTTWNSRVRMLGTAVYFTSTGNGGSTWTGTGTSYTDYNGHNSYVAAADSKYANPATIYRMFINVKVCDTTVQLENNCTAYGSNFKPEGLMQQYALKLRYSAFGYYNHDGNRDGGVMRARMKYLAPTKPVPGSTAISNAAAEWDATTGVMLTNPDVADAAATVTNAAAAGWAVGITNSGVMNYLNKFGYSAQTYKGNDPVGELYYAATRYFRNLGNVASYSTLAGAGNSATAARWLDGFPAITTWDDPIVYSCQKNFILGIGDTYSWYDGNVPGSTLRSGEPGVPAEVTADTTVNAATATNMVGVLEGKTGGTTLGASWNASGRGNTMYIAGLAYDAHTSDIRPLMDGKQTINTYWLDVHENQNYEHKNQYWLAAKYGGFIVPTGFSTYATGNTTTTIPTTAWYTSNDTVPFSGTTYRTANGISFSTDGTTSTDPRPDNYFPGNSPATMKAGLTAAFAKIAAEASEQTTTGFSTSDPVQAESGNANYVVSYNPNNWTSTLTGQLITYDTNGLATFTDVWNATILLNARTSTNRLIVTCCTSAGTGLPFTHSSLSGATLDSRTDYNSFGSITGVSSSSQSIPDYIAYLRGDRSNELVSTTTSSTGKYRARAHLLGDVVNGKLAPVPAPQADYYDVYNPGYSSFMADYGNRATVIYTPSNDGMLHAFDGTVPTSTTSTCISSLTTPSTACGKELFAYIPSFAYAGTTTAADSGLASLGKPSGFTHHFIVDGTPVSADVDFYKTNTPVATSNDWRTILVGGLGKGGKGYYSLDITNPASWTSESAIASKVLWEFTDTAMGYSYGNAAIVKTPEFGWTVIVASGYNNSDGKGYFYFINPRNGALLKKVATPEGSAASPINLAHIQPYIPSKASYLADSVYAGDLQGNVWRLDLTATSDATTTGSTTTTSSSYNYALSKIATLTDTSGASQPITTRPVVAADPNSGKRYVLIGTGRLLSDSDVTSTQTQTFYAIIDGTKGYGNFYNSSTSTTSGSTVSTSSGIPYPGAVSLPIVRSQLVANTDLLTGIGSSVTEPMGWYYDLGASTNGITEQINVHPIENNGIVSFAANLPNGDACNPSGTGREFSVNYSEGITALTNSGGAVAYISSSSSIISITSISKPKGKAVNFAKTDGTNDQQMTKSKPVYKRLNWREIPTAD
jgi:type IV pilus assembly protein PilY1